MKSNPTDPNGHASPSRPRFPFVILFFVWCLVFVTTTLVTLILPESFLSTARIKIERDPPGIGGLVTGAVSDYDPHFLQTEQEVIQCEVVLGKVIADLDLCRYWGRKYAGGESLKTSEAISLLKARIDLRLVRNTSLLDIRVFSEKAEEAARIANAIAAAYKRHRQDQRRELHQGVIRALEERLQAQQERIRAAQANVDRLRKELNIPDAAAVGEGTAQTRSFFEAKRYLEELQRSCQLHDTKIAADQTDLALPATRMVEIVDSAYPGIRPIRPNKPLNIALGTIIGGVGGVFLATLVYVLQLREFRRVSGAPRTQFPPRFRAIVHILIALVVGFIIGYLLANPLSFVTIISVPLTLLLGGIACAYLELANPRLAPESPAAPGEVRPNSASLHQ